MLNKDRLETNILRLRTVAIRLCFQTMETVKYGGNVHTSLKECAKHLESQFWSSAWHEAHDACRFARKRSKSHERCQDILSLVNSIVELTEVLEGAE